MNAHSADSRQRRRFQINPGPLRVVPDRMAREPEHNAWRCEATTRDGLRCFRAYVYEDDHGRLCTQHHRIAVKS